MAPRCEGRTLAIEALLTGEDQASIRSVFRIPLCPMYSAGCGTNRIARRGDTSGPVFRGNTRLFLACSAPRTPATFRITWPDPSLIAGLWSIHVQAQAFSEIAGPEEAL